MSDQHRYWSDMIWHWKIARQEARLMIFRCGVVIWGNVCRYACVWSVQVSETQSEMFIIVAHSEVNTCETVCSPTNVIMGFG